MDEKYVVFRREEFEFFRRQVEREVPGDDIPGVGALHDAVVIRTKDIYAGPALHAYASAVITTMEFLPEGHPHREALDKVANYFLDRAAEADQLRREHKSGVPKAP